MFECIFNWGLLKKVESADNFLNLLELYGIVQWYVGVKMHGFL